MPPGERGGADAVDTHTLGRDQLRLLSVAEGFLESSVLFALAKLGLFERIGDGSWSPEELAPGLGAEPEALARLLRGGVAIGVLTSDDDGRFRMAPAHRSLLASPDVPGYLGHWILNLDFFQGALSHLDEAVLGSRPAVALSEEHLSTPSEKTRDFTLAMHDYASLRGAELTRFLDTSGCTSLLDVGCGPGTYAFQLGVANPALELTLVDRPAVLEVAKEVGDRYPLDGRVRYLAVDVRREPIPGRYDLVLVSNALHMLGGQESRELLGRLHQSVTKDGSLVVHAQYLRDDRLGGRWPVFVDLLQLCLTAEGRNHTAAETRTWLEEAGFTDVELCPMSLLNTNSFLRGYRRR